MAGLKTWMKYLGYPVSFRKRDWAVFKTLANNNNQISSAELLKIELGKTVFDDIRGAEKPPAQEAAPKADPLAGPVHVLGIYKNPHMKYLHINPLFNTLLSMAIVGFTRSTPRDKYSLKKMSPAVADKDYRSIYLNRAFVFSPLGQVMFLAWFHSMATGLAAAVTGGLRAIAQTVSAHYVTAAAGASLSASSARPFWVRLLELPVASFTDTLGHEHIHFLQKQDRDTGRSGFNAMGGAFRHKAMQQVKAEHAGAAAFDSYASLGMVRYFLGDHEIQARLHTLMAHGAKRWGRLPKTRNELWRALDDCGLAMPEDARREMQQSLKDNFNAAAVFGGKPGTGPKLSRLARRCFSPDVAELRIAQNALHSKALKEEFWQETLPYLYGHLLELYGRPTGRADMNCGLPPSPPTRALPRRPKAVQDAVGT